MTLGIPSVPGFWPDYYACWEDGILDTINRMLEEQSEDFPNTCCVGFTVEYPGSIHIEAEKRLVRIYPKVKNKEFTFDFYTKEKT